MSIGERLRALRGSKTLREIADASGLTVSALAMYERNERVPRDEIKVQLADFYGTTVQELFFDKQ